MKFTEFLIEEQTSQEDVVKWFAKHSSMSFGVNSMHWNTRDKTLHLASDCTITACDTEIPFQFSSCPKDFTLMNSTQSDLPFSSRAVVLAQLTIEKVKGLIAPSKFPAFVNKLKIIDCPDLVELNKLPDTNSSLQISKCPKLKTIKKILAAKEVRLTSLAITKLPKFENAYNLHELSIGGNKDLNLNFATMQKFPSLSGLYLGEGFSKNCSLQGIHESLPNLKYITVGSLGSIRSHVLSVLKIEGFKEIQTMTGDTSGWIGVVNKYVGQGNDGIFNCQTELLDLGLDDLAQL